MPPTMRAAARGMSSKPAATSAPRIAAPYVLRASASSTGRTSSSCRGRSSVTWPSISSIFLTVKRIDGPLGTLPVRSERCPSGLRSATGNRVRAERRVAGSNPALSAYASRAGSAGSLASTRVGEWRPRISPGHGPGEGPCDLPLVIAEAESAMGPRLLHPGDAYAERDRARLQRWLQWGLGYYTPETRCRPRRAAANERASMWPGLLHPGDVIGAMLLAVLVVLQWGRG